MCERFVSTAAHVRIGLLGLETDRQLLVELPDELAERLGLEAAAVPPSRQEVIQKLVEQRTAARDQAFAAFREKVQDLPGLLAQFSTCVRCLNCMTACPICYCPECIFKTSTFAHSADQYYRWAERKGAVRLPAETLLFHLTRLNHMVTSCVGCGMCESACPSELPVALVFRAIGQRVQALFDYVPGRSLEEEVPLSTFREDELWEYGGR